MGDISLTILTHRIGAGVGREEGLQFGNSGQPFTLIGAAHVGTNLSSRRYIASLQWVEEEKAGTAL